MNKYKLKKDLPFAKAGAEVKIEMGLVLINVKYFHLVAIRNESIESLAIGAADDLPTLIAEGWVEKVKPREWYLIPNSLPIFEPYAVRSADSNMDGFKNIIKVREVLE